MQRAAWVLTAVSAVLVAGCGSGTKTVTVTTPSTPTGPTFTTLSGPTPTSPVSTLSGTGTTTVPVTPTTTTRAPAPATPTVHISTFKSPSGNIGCDVIDGSARCDIKQRSWSPPPTPKSCPPIVDFGQGLVVGGSGPAQFVCAGDTTLDPSAQALAYGTDTVVGSFRCASRTSGMTCTKTDTGHGFFISFQSYRTF
jgi:hypothetical protein